MNIVVYRGFHAIILGVLINISSIAIAEPLPTTNSDAPSVSPEIIKEDNEEIELILQTYVENIILGDEFGIKKGNQVFLGIQNLFSLLNFAITVNTKKKIANGWFIKENYSFSLDKPNSAESSKTVMITAKNQKLKITPNNILYKSDDIYIDAKTIFQALSLDYKINTSALTLQLLPTEPLPIQNKLARKNRKKTRTRNLSATLPKKRIPYKLWTIPFIDAQTRYSSTSLGFATSSYSILAAGDLAYMTGTYYLQGDDKDSLKFLRIKLSRDSLSNNLLGPLKATHFSFGEINPNAGGGVGSAGQEIGARITNKPFGRNIRLQKTDFIGNAQPDWDVELYRNNIFLGGQTVSESGRYEFFNQNILPGKNYFKLIFYGPEGQQYEKIETINIERGGISTGKTFYDISLSKQYSRFFELRDNIKPIQRDDRRLNLTLFRDVNQYISLIGTYSGYTFLNGVQHYFIKPGIRIFALNTLLFANTTRDVNGAYLTYYSLSKILWKQALSYSKTQQSRNFYTEFTDAILPSQDKQNIELSGRILKSNPLKINYRLNASRSTIEGTQVTDQYNTDLNVNIFGLAMSNNLTYTTTSTDNTKKTKTLIGSANLNRSIYRFNIRGGADYQLEPVKDVRLKRLSNLFGNISLLAFTKMRMQYGYNYVPQTTITSHSFRLNWRTNKFTFISDYTKNSNNSYTMYVGINFSLGYDKNSSSFKMGAERIARTGAISAKIFIDNNNNGAHDHDEPLIKGAKIKAEQARKNGKTNKDGAIFLTGLPIDRNTDIKLDVSSLEDPFLTPAKQGYSFTPRPGVIEAISIPLVTSGEVEGTVYLENKNGSTQSIGYAPLILTNIRTREKHTTMSAYDGFYLFSSIPPGKYLVAIDRSYLKRYEYSARKPMPRVVTIHPSGNIEMGNDFTIYTLASDE